jgi:hypothetical protein
MDAARTTEMLGCGRHFPNLQTDSDEAGRAGVIGGVFRIWIAAT